MPSRPTPRLADHHRLDAVRAHLLELAGDREGAVGHYRAAASKTRSLPERNYLSHPSRATRRASITSQSTSCVHVSCASRSASFRSLAPRRTPGLPGEHDRDQQDPDRDGEQAAHPGLTRLTMRGESDSDHQDHQEQSAEVETKALMSWSPNEVADLILPIMFPKIDCLFLEGSL